ncbi:hypothetical protein PEPS_15380 [Persicobacter psychrovividus]|uniref:DUF3592 domain-containing protein n=2 Tax=Persicobacter psychrovividus TaxID=387638 RepID=A0ABN6L7Q1_9BACT|nr:hypothetical protein PEPS_15380 [Persicobacter psychrovividus]
MVNKWLGKIIEFRAIILISIIFIYFLTIGIKGKLKTYLLDHYAIEIPARVINEKNFWGNSPVSHTFSYSYEFSVDGKRFKADSRNKTLKVGNHITIEYLPAYPTFSRISQNSQTHKK